jgi:hypothetical protein
MAFLLSLTRVTSCDLDLWEGFDIIILLSSNLYLKSRQLYPTFYFLRKGIMKPALLCIFGLPPSLIMPLSVKFDFFFGDEAMWRKIWFLTRGCFHSEFLEFQSYSKHRNHFDIGIKQTRFEKIQVIPMDKFS